MLQQYSIASRMVSIIQTIQLNRETGMLIAKRGGNVSAEEGRIVFTNGRIVDINVSRHSGSDAFNYISAWENCLVSFIPQDPSKDITHLLENSSMVARAQPEEQKKSGVPSGPLPKGARPAHDHRQHQSTDTPVPTSMLDPTDTPVPADTPVPTDTFSLALTEQEPVTYAPFLIQPLPIALRKIEQMGLSRAHRQLVLLIDGKRSIEELVHMMGRTTDNIQRLVRDLTSLRLIEISSSS